MLLNSFLYFDSSVFCGTCYSHYLLPIFLKLISTHLMYFDILNSLSFSSLLMAQKWSQRSFSSCFFKMLESLSQSPFDCVLTLRVKIPVQAVDLVLPTGGRG